MARFWAELLGREAVDEEDRVLVPGDQRQVGLRFVAASTYKVGLNRLHLHLTSASPEGQRATVERAWRNPHHYPGEPADTRVMDSPTHQPQGAPLWMRLIAYAIGMFVACNFAFFLGMAHFMEVTCGSGGECDLAGLEGMAWTAVVFVLGCLVVLVNELRLARRRGRP